jgi:hypothetical protein
MKAPVNPFQEVAAFTKTKFEKVHSPYVRKIPHTGQPIGNGTPEAPVGSPVFGLSLKGISMSES